MITPPPPGQHRGPGQRMKCERLQSRGLHIKYTSKKAAKTYQIYLIMYSFVYIYIIYSSICKYKKYNIIHGGAIESFCFHNSNVPSIITPYNSNEPLHATGLFFWKIPWWLCYLFKSLNSSCIQMVTNGSPKKRTCSRHGTCKMVCSKSKILFKKCNLL